MIGDIDDLFGKQARVDGVQHGADARNPVIAFQMAIAVPGQGRDTVTKRDTQADEGLCQLLGTRVGVRIAVAVYRALDSA